MISLADTLDVLRPHLEHGWGGSSLSGVQEVAAHFPAGLTDWFYLESRLSTADGSQDLIFRVDARGRRVLEGILARACGPATFHGPGWEAVRSLCAEWRRSDQLADARMHALWLEFDILPQALAAGSPQPGVFVGLARPTGENTSRRRLTLNSLAALLAPAAGDTLFAQVTRCVEALPAGAFVAYMGGFAHRDASAVRLCIAGLSHHAVPAFLDQVGWDPTEGDLLKLLERIRVVRADTPHPDPALLHLDLQPHGCGSAIGLEFAFSRREQARGRIAEMRFLSYLEGRGLCSPADVARIVGFPGVTREQLPHELWVTLVTRRLNHVKLVFDRGASVTAKAYRSVHALPLIRRRAAGTGGDRTPALPHGGGALLHSGGESVMNSLNH